MSFNANHPECGLDEIFITNADDSTYSKVGWTTKRKGAVSYTSSGEPCGNKWLGSFPVFAKRSEIGKVDPKTMELLERLNQR